MEKHEYACKITEIIASKSDCRRDKVGCVFFNKDYEVLATGFNGTPRGLVHCNDRVCDITKHCKRTAHAEQNAIVQAAKNGITLKDTILYITSSPCETCAKLLINLGVRLIVSKKKYNQKGLDWLEEACIEHRWWGKEL